MSAEDEARLFECFVKVDECSVDPNIESRTYNRSLGLFHGHPDIIRRFLVESGLCSQPDLQPRTISNITPEMLDDLAEAKTELRRAEQRLNQIKRASGV